MLRLEAASFPDDPYPRRVFLGCHGRSPGLFLVATIDGSPVRLAGYLIARIEDLPAGHSATTRGRIVSIAVDLDSRRQGVARALSGEIISRLEDSGAAFIDLETRVDNRSAIQLWEELGFRGTGVVPGYYGDGTAALIMRKDLRSPGDSGPAET